MPDTRSSSSAAAGPRCNPCPARELQPPAGVPGNPGEAATSVRSNEKSILKRASGNQPKSLLQHVAPAANPPVSPGQGSPYIPTAPARQEVGMLNDSNLRASGLNAQEQLLRSDSVRPRRIGMPLQGRYADSETIQGAPIGGGTPLGLSMPGRLRLTASPVPMPRGSSLSGPDDLELPTTAIDEVEGNGSGVLAGTRSPSKLPRGTTGNEGEPEAASGDFFVNDDFFGSLFDLEWSYANKEELEKNYMATQEAAYPKNPSTWREDLKDYCISLYGWGWCMIPFRCSCRWFGQVGPSLLAGFFIPFSLVPTAMTCAVISGFPVSAALNSCWILCVISSLFGGAPGTVSAVTEAISTALVTTVTADCNEKECVYKGREFIFPAGILCGILQCLCGFGGFGRYVSLVPAASKVGYVNAVAIINCRSQLHAFKYDPVTSTGYEWLLVLGLIAEVCLIMHFWPMFAPWKMGGYFPASAVALAASVATEFLLVRRLSNMQTKTVGDVSLLAGGGNLPSWFLLSPVFQPPSDEMLSFKGIYRLIEVALTLVLLSSMSTVMTLEKIQESSNWVFKCNRQLVALGGANAVSCLLGCLPGTTGMMVSLLANRMGARSKEGPLLAGMFLLIFTSAAYHVLDVIPLGGLSGAIIYTAASAVSWKTFPPLLAAFLPRFLCKKHPSLQLRLSKTEAAVVLLTTVLGATFDLGSALLIGIFISLSSFAWSSLRRFSLESEADTQNDTKYYYINGPLFFSTARQLAKEFNERTAPKRSVVVLLAAAAAPEHAVLLVLRDIANRHEALGKELVFYGITPKGALVGMHAGKSLERDRGEILDVQQEETLFR